MADRFLTVNTGKVVETVRKSMQERVDRAVAGYKVVLDSLQREVASALRRFDDPGYRNSTVAAQSEGYVDSLQHNIGNMATQLADAAARVTEARAMRDQALADLKARLEVE